MDYLDPLEPSIPKERKIPVSDSFQGMRTDFAYKKIYLIEKALTMYKKGKTNGCVIATP